jgi:hypothetical protein
MGVQYFHICHKPLVTMIYYLRLNREKMSSFKNGTVWELNEILTGPFADEIFFYLVRERDRDKNN